MTWLIFAPNFLSPRKICFYIQKTDGLLETGFFFLYCFFFLMIAHKIEKTSALLLALLYRFYLIGGWFDHLLSQRLNNWRCCFCFLFKFCFFFVEILLFFLLRFLVKMIFFMLVFELNIFLSRVFLSKWHFAST